MVLLYEIYSSAQFIEYQDRLKLNKFVQPEAAQIWNAEIVSSVTRQLANAEIISSYFILLRIAKKNAKFFAIQNLRAIFAALKSGGVTHRKKCSCLNW
ncbi:MAG: hypothetical protein LBK18_08945 [Prevotellaceae bacterium]|jgi:hypothetical protein|nr:hypothetical protein [Prevotellaceae bacterium]